MSRAIKFAVAILCVGAGFALALAGGVALIAGQWIVIFGAATSAQVKMGIVWIVAALFGGAMLQYVGIRLLASEPPFGWPWIVLAFIPAVAIATHYGLGIVGLFLAAFMVAVVNRQVKQARAGRLARTRAAGFGDANA